ncbi:NAD-dependent deacetylase [Haladaptatus litoreus]|uniref:NAD-dependent deacetylase n=1 Tax=Haladaptatus litoreus TaxID=553468 RepID=A0A1N7E5I0_9EURY|nr:Sir2 family NAD-dependent protein deacetylase [Haladaptatus litoreus]SIR83286.1 NAD-dependent deacetylase [Haladaptatus litoreus]
MEQVAHLAAAIRDADSVVALTGAGVSTASGIPDFRSDSGIWNRFDPEDFHYRRFCNDPEDFWKDRVSLHETMFGDGIEPNSAHDALRELSKNGHLHALVTQNTDGLHDTTATSAELIELHGNAHRVVCDSCGHKTDAAPIRERVESGERPPRCGDCDGIFKPDVVLFGEQLEKSDLQRARKRSRNADVFLAIGSSLSVEPAASLPRIAERNDATTAVVNLDETPFSALADFDIRGDVTDVLPTLCEEVAD